MTIFEMLLLFADGFGHCFGFDFLWVPQNEDKSSLCPEDAERLLGRLVRFNLTLGMLCYGLVYIPSLAIWNIRVALRAKWNYPQTCLVPEDLNPAKAKLKAFGSNQPK